MRESFLTVGRLKHAEAGWISEARIQPAPYHEVSQHVDLLSVELWLVSWLILAGSPRLVARLGDPFRFHDQYLHHGSKCIGHEIGADHERLEDLVHDTFAHLSKILFNSALGIVRGLVGRMAPIQDLSLQVEELLTVEHDLKVPLLRVIVLVDHQVL